MTAQIDFASIGDQIGQEIAVSPWLDVTQERINAFAEATDDRQWIHVDPARAAAESPFKSTIAHGFLTLSLVSVLLTQNMPDWGRNVVYGVAILVILLLYGRERRHQ